VFRAEGYYDGSETHLDLTVAPGIEHEFDSYSTGPVTLNTVTIDMGRSDLVIETEKAKDELTASEPLDEMVKRLYTPDKRPIAAINADFWGARHIPDGLFVDEGMIWKNPYGTRSVFAFDDEGNFSIGPPQWSVVLRGGRLDQSLPIDRVNLSFHSDDPKDVIAYTWPYGESSPAPEPGQAQVVLDLPGGEWLPNAPAEVTVRSVDQAGTTTLDRHTVVLIIDSERPAWIRTGVVATLTARLGNLPGKVLGVVGGGPQLVRDGKVVATEAAEREKIGRNFVTDLHPRTAIGIKSDGQTLVFVVVDGRQPGRSVGINLPALAEWMIAKGCAVAMNFDGGGSSTMDVRDEIVNFPSDSGGPRPISTALVVFRTAPIGSLADLKIMPRNSILPLNTRIQLKAEGFDAGQEPVSLDGWTLDWKVRAKDAEVDPNGILKTGSEPGEAEVTLRAKPASSSASLPAGTSYPEAQTHFTLAAPERLRVFPSAILLETGDETSLRFQATTADGRRFLPDPSIWEITVPPFLRFVPAEGRLKAVGAGTGFLRATLGGKSERVPVAVDSFKESLAYSFDTLPAESMGDWIQAVRYNPEGTSIELEKDDRKEGDASWSFAYAMVHGGVTRIALPIDATLPGKPLAVGLWVYGDGQKQWLRGELRDAQNHGYYLDFTNATTGIDWSGEWRFVQASLDAATAMGGYAGPMTPPFTVKTVYVAQGQEAAKRDGKILLDGLYALDLPETLAAPKSP